MTNEHHHLDSQPPPDISIALTLREAEILLIEAEYSRSAALIVLGISPAADRRVPTAR